MSPRSHPAKQIGISSYSAAYSGSITETVALSVGGNAAADDGAPTRFPNPQRRLPALGFPSHRRQACRQKRQRSPQTGSAPQYQAAFDISCFRFSLRRGGRAGSFSRPPPHIHSDVFHGTGAYSKSAKRRQCRHRKPAGESSIESDWLCLRFLACRPAGPGHPVCPACPGRQAHPAYPGCQAHPAYPGRQVRPACPGRQAHPACPGRQARPACPARQAHPACPGRQARPACPGRQARPAYPGRRARPARRGHRRGVGIRVRAGIGGIRAAAVVRPHQDKREKPPSPIENWMPYWVVSSLTVSISDVPTSFRSKPSFVPSGAGP